MQTTSHFVWIELKLELFSDLYVRVFWYLKELNNIWEINISSNNIYLYKINSKFKEELQIKI